MNPLIFVVHRTNGHDFGVLYHEDTLPPKHDPVVYQLRLDTHPNADALAAMSLTELWKRYLAGRELGALP